MTPPSWTGIVGATLMVAATTADDAIWLVPYTKTNLPLYTRLIHGALFIATLEILVCICVAFASGFRLVVSGGNDENILMGSIGAGICWVIAVGLYIKKWLKIRRKASAQLELQRASTLRVENYGSVKTSEEDFSNERLQDAELSLDCEALKDENDIGTILCPWAVISFTFLGALDEISYFPSLVLGGVFTPIDLCLGTLFAAIIILIVVTLLLSECKPLLDWLDRIPLYAIVATFAIVLTAGVVLDVLKDKSKV